MADVMQVFGYGSLVNTRTHSHTDHQPARLKGYRRVWRATTLRPLAFLSVERCAATEIDGLIATVPETEEDALNAREAAYVKVNAADQLVPPPDQGKVMLYKINARHLAPAETRHPILLSYLDVVAEGYLDVFGPESLEHFGETTSGWDTPVLDDRADPRYPRATSPGTDITSRVDALLRALDARFL